MAWTRDLEECSGSSSITIIYHVGDHFGLTVREITRIPEHTYAFITLILINHICKLSPTRSYSNSNHNLKAALRTRRYKKYKLIRLLLLFTNLLCYTFINIFSIFFLSIKILLQIFYKWNILFIQN